MLWYCVGVEFSRFDMRTPLRWLYASLIVSALGISGCSLLERDETQVILAPNGPVVFEQTESTCNGAEKLNSSGVPSGSIVPLEISRDNRRFRGVAWFVSDNYLVTSYDAVERSSQLANGNTAKTLELVAFNERTNVALLRSQQKGTPLKLASYEGNGQPFVTLVGYRSGQLSVSTGQITDTDFSKAKHEFFSTAKSIPGFAGGPTLDCGGAVVGVTSSGLISWDKELSLHVSSGAVIEMLNSYNGKSGALPQQ